MAGGTFAQEKPKQGQGKPALYLGLLLGIVAAVLVAFILSKDSSVVETKVVPATRVAVVATEDIPARTRLTASSLKVEVFNLEDVDAEAFTSVSQVVNRVTSSDLVAGQVILPVLVSETRGAGLDFSLKQGMRAVSISVKEVVTAGGNVLPGNQVDVIALFELGKGTNLTSLIEGLLGEAGSLPLVVAGDASPPTIGEARSLPPVVAGGSSTLTITLLQDVRVLAVAQNLPGEAAPSSTEKPELGAAIRGEADPNPKAATVTLEITPQQAQLLAMADQLGTLRLALRPFGEQGRVPVAPFLTVIED